jgi:hypothetical protein
MKGIILSLLRLLSLLHLKARGVDCGNSLICNGFPYIRRKGSGIISLGPNVTLNASRWGNWLGTPGGTVLSVEDGAMLVLKASSGISSSHLIANVGIEIGEGSLIGAGCLICDSDMHEVPLGSDKAVAKAPIIIGKNVFVGARSIILKGVAIGDGSVIGAGSVVSKSIPAGSLAAGNPAKVIRQLG